MFESLTRFSPVT